VKAVHVLRRIDGVEDLLRGGLPHRRRKRRLDENPVMRLARVQQGHDGEQLLEGGIGG
jgi:hypothetical protein